MNKSIDKKAVGNKANATATSKAVNDTILDVEDGKPAIHKLEDGRQVAVKSSKAGLYEGLVIFKTHGKNPRRADTFGWHAWEGLDNGMTYADYKQTPYGRADHIKWDDDRGFIAMKSWDKYCQLVKQGKARLPIADSRREAVLEAIGLPTTTKPNADGFIATNRA